MKESLRSFNNEDEISPIEILHKIGSIWNFLIRKITIILIVGFIGACIGFLYAWLRPVKYESHMSFVVDDSKSGMGGLASLAGQFGLDVGASSNSGVFSGDNVLLFLKSESLCRETLLTNYDSSGQEILADKYAEVNELKSSWAKNKKIGQINFTKYRDGSFPRLEDSLIQLVTQRILKKDLGVDKPDKKASFIDVTVSMRDELLSKLFCDRLVKIATDRYVESKTKVKALNVAKLQHRADSLGNLLNNQTYSAAASQQSLIDLNPALRTAPVTSEIATRNKTMIATIFAEVVKNLEIAKVALNQETPTIQIVDQSTFPLKQDRVSKAVAAIVTGLLFGMLAIFFLLFKRWWNAQTRKQRESSTSGKISVPVEGSKTISYSNKIQ